MSKELKQLITRELTNRFQNIEGCVLVGFSRLGASSATAMREDLRQQGIEFAVIRNRLYLKALEEIQSPEFVDETGIRELCLGPTAVVYGEEDAVQPAKAIVEWRKKEQALEIKGGIQHGRVLSNAEVERLAKLPSREVLLSQIAGLVQAPLSKVANVSGALLRNVVYAVKALEEKAPGAE